MRVNYDAMEQFGMSVTSIKSTADMIICIDDALKMIEYYDKVPTLRLIAFNSQTRSPKLVHAYLTKRMSLLKKKVHCKTLFMELTWILNALHLVVNQRCYLMKSIKLHYLKKSRIIMLSDLIYGHLTQYIRRPLIHHIIALEDVCRALSNELHKIE